MPATGPSTFSQPADLPGNSAALFCFGPAPILELSLNGLFLSLVRQLRAAPITNSAGIFELSAFPATRELCAPAQRRSDRCRR